MNNIYLSMDQLNKVNNVIKSYHTSKFSRISPRTILQSQTNLLFFDMKITQETQINVIYEVLEINCKIGDMITSV